MKKMDWFNDARIIRSRLQPSALKGFNGQTEQGQLRLRYIRL